MLRFFRWLLGRKPAETTPDPLAKPSGRKSSTSLRLDQGTARNQIDNERKRKRRTADDMGDQER